MNTKPHIFENEYDNTFINFHNVEMVDVLPTGKHEDNQVKVYFASGRVVVYENTEADRFTTAWRRFVR